MIRIVLDSNVLISALGIRSALRPIWDAFTSGGVQIVVSEDVLREYEEILQQHSAPGAAEIVMKILDESPDVIFQRVSYNWNAITADPDDDKFFDTAVTANADFIVTNDRHFDVTKHIIFPRVHVISAKEFITVLGMSNP